MSFLCLSSVREIDSCENVLVFATDLQKLGNFGIFALVFFSTIVHSGKKHASPFKVPEGVNIPIGKTSP